MGGSEMSDDVCNILCGEDVYFDTAYVLRFLSKDTIIQIIERHGEDKILFASDSPWSDICGDVKIIRSLNLPKETEEKILCTNAQGLLGI
jgi:predicted TIM-barrel fold metal-dependent hydrolase